MAYNSKKCLTFGESGLVKIVSEFSTGADGTVKTLKNSDSIRNYSFVIIPFYFQYYDSIDENYRDFGTVFTCPAVGVYDYGQNAYSLTDSTIPFGIRYCGGSNAEGEGTNNIFISSATGDTIRVAGIWGITAS